MEDFLFRGSLNQLDPDLFELTSIEAERQARKLILIPSESQAPLAVREALSSAFQNIYAEGYPDESSRTLSEKQIFDYDNRLAHFRRYSDPRYYKGVEYADIAEMIARRRCAEAFATNEITSDEIYVNVQALSGGPANNAVYHALLNPGDTFMGMNLLHGGHLSHGSPVNRSGKIYNAVHYTVDQESERIDYDQIEELAITHKPKFIIAGYSSYPWQVDWARFRSIADSTGAYLFADIAHVAGLIAAGVYPSPVGFADVITFTTHKSLCGPRGACILTTDRLLSRKIDRAVFPGEQGGPHVNTFVAMALSFKLARSEQFKRLQGQIVKNCIALTDRLNENGLRIPYGGTDTHLLNIDCSTMVGSDGTSLSGDMASRVLDIAGIVVNRNTIPGDRSALAPSGIRLGTPWVTQRGLKVKEMEDLADIISELLFACAPYGLQGKKSRLRRTKVDFKVLQRLKLSVRDLAEEAGIDFQPTQHTYPHFYYQEPINKRESSMLRIGGERVREFLNYALASSVDELKPGEIQSTKIHTPEGIIEGILKCESHYQFVLRMDGDERGLSGAWLRSLSDGYVRFDDDLARKLPGPVWVRDLFDYPTFESDKKDNGQGKPYYIGIQDQKDQSLPPFEWQDKEADLRRTALYKAHVELGAKMIPFAGWEMPVWYSSVLDEHKAVREAAGVFDVSHMGVYQIEGPDAVVFLNCVVGNDVGRLKLGEATYTHFLDPTGDVIDDLYVYRLDLEKFMIVVNAANDEKDWAWLNSVKNGTVLVSEERPGSKLYGRNAVLRNLRDPIEGNEMRVDIALQGPRSRDILLALGTDFQTNRRIISLKRNDLCRAEIGGFELIVARTGYTGEKMAFELFVHPERSRELFLSILDAGQSFGIKPIGLGARDSLRTEAGLPLYGHEMGNGSGERGQADLGAAEAGFGSYVKVYKPWFIGRQANIARKRKGVIARFQFEQKGVRMAHKGDPVLDMRGRTIGWVTSCAVDSEGYLTGQAFIENKHAIVNNSILVYQSAPEKVGKAPADLEVGDKTSIPGLASVVERFRK